uniref:Small ribosomal subunit protein uS13c n=1 Tax=Astrosyne radiata TaxID=1158023 RepID=A0A2U9NTF0_9STRA|nr:ribosomal protein S13 [Astrosyne radiata]AWT40368.1 ribosomal protein S13 [Astrosyne radiata]
MIRLIGINLPKQKKISYALTCIYGIGIESSKKILKKANIDINKRTYQLNTKEIVELRKTLADTTLKLEGDLKRFNNLNIKRLSDINCYRGRRHRMNLPVRGQRTRTNARSRRGKKKKLKQKKTQFTKPKR